MTTITANQFISIVQKIENSNPLTANDLEFLNSCTQLQSSWKDRFWSYIRTPVDQGSVESINALSTQILGQGASALIQVKDKLRSYEHLTPHEAFSFARLINQYLARNDLFENRLRDFRSTTGRDPNYQELVSLVIAFNEEIQPKKSMAGQSVAVIQFDNEMVREKGELKVEYDIDGYLQITEGPIGPLDIRFKQVLTTAQQTEMVELYHSIADDAPYNNLGELLEYLSYYQQQREINPHLTFQEAYESYRPNLAHIFEKYKSGTCILLASKFCDDLAKRGISAQILATSTSNPWSTLPIPGLEEQVRWDALARHTKGVDHSDALCFFYDENNEEKILRFKCSFDKTTQEEVKQYKASKLYSCFESFKTDFIPNREFANRVIDHGEIGKARLLGRYKAIVKKDEMIFGADFLRGNIYLRVAEKKDLPLNAKGVISIEMSDLTTPDCLGTYFINGKETKMTHREALGMILSRVRREVDLPADVEQNLISLAPLAPELFKGFFIQPMPLIRQTYSDLLAIGKKMGEIEKSSPTTYYVVMPELFENVADPIYYNQEDAATKIAAFKDRVMSY
jgi:hypothetical protein